MVSTTPAFNLKVVLKETGIAADTLRAWERRYGLPMPQRSAGGHRLYSQRDIETIKWLTNLLVERNISVSLLPAFLELYAQATRDVMGKEAQAISERLTVEAQKLKT